MLTDNLSEHFLSKYHKNRLSYLRVLCMCLLKTCPTRILHNVILQVKNTKKLSISQLSCLFFIWNGPFNHNGPFHINVQQWFFNFDWNLKTAVPRTCNESLGSHNKITKPNTTLWKPCTSNQLNCDKFDRNKMLMNWVNFKSNNFDLFERSI